MTTILLVTVEPPWPPHHGGRLRVARVAEALGEHADVVVIYPEHGVASPGPVTSRSLRWRPVRQRHSRFSSRPHLGRYYLEPVRAELIAVAREVRPDVVYWSHSYLAACAPAELRAAPTVVEFANIEGHRLRTLANAAGGLRRAARALEAYKAGVWEPRVARDADVCVALSDQDERELRAWGANAVLAPNGVDRLPYAPSPADGYVLAMASYDYEPNVAAVREVVEQVWPDVRTRLPQAELVVAGRGSEAIRAEFEAVPGVRVAGTVDDVTDTYAGAAVALAPARTGGGSQLKLTESMSRGRCVVMSPFAANGLPAALRGSRAGRVAADPAQFVEAIAEALVDVTGRQARERDGWQSSQELGWSQTMRPIVEAIDHLVSGRPVR